MSPRRRKRPPCSPWAALPPDIAGEVLLRLPSYADRICFAAVCRPWRASAEQHRSPPPPLPCLVFGDGTFRGLAHDERPFRLPSAAGFLGSCDDCLLFNHGDAGYSLVNPFSKATSMAPPLPSLSSGIHAQHHDESVVQAVAERAMPEYDRRGLAMSGVVPDPRPPAALSVRKLAVCSSGVVAAVVGDGHLGKIALCRPGAAAWSSLSNQGQWRRTKDMAMHQGTLYAVDHNEDLLAVSIVGGEDDDDGAPPALSAIARVITGDPPSFSGPRRLTLHYLVSDSGGGELLMVRREVCRERPGQGRGIDERFTVFKADLGSSRWEEMSAIADDMALLLGQWCSVAVRLTEERRRECGGVIYFLEDGIVGQQDRQYSLSAYDYNNSSIHSSYRLQPVVWRDGADLPATWIVPQVD